MGREIAYVENLTSLNLTTLSFDCISSLSPLLSSPIHISTCSQDSSAYSHNLHFLFSSSSQYLSSLISLPNLNLAILVILLSFSFSFKYSGNPTVLISLNSTQHLILLKYYIEYKYFSNITCLMRLSIPSYVCKIFYV